MKLSLPREGRPRVSGDYAYYKEGTPEEEIVHIPSNTSNVTYYQSERVLNPEGCDHIFNIADMAKREAVCRCGSAVSFVVGINLLHTSDTNTIIFQGKSYPLV